MDGLTTAFGFDGTVDADVDGHRDRGPRRRHRARPARRPRRSHAAGIQDLARVAAQRRLGDHETRLRVDVAGYREKRRAALERFAAHGGRAGPRRPASARSLEPMPSADRKVIHDVLAAIDGVASRSEGEDPTAASSSPRLTLTAPVDDAGARSTRWRRPAPRDARWPPIAEVIDHAGAFVAALGRRVRARSSTSAAAAACPVW